MEKESSEIVKLTERISKDPKSKLFVPLAEEYKKIGDLEMAVYVLTEGLKNNPSYVTARAILGRLLLDQGDLAGAQKELLEVVKVIPDNLLAQRKLGDICVLQDRPQDALKHYKIVLALNPRDEEIAALLSDIEAGHDVSARLQQPKAQSAGAVAAKPQIKPQAKPAVPSPLKPEPKPQPQQQAAPAPQAQAAPAPAPAPLVEQPVVLEKPEPAPIPVSPPAAPIEALQAAPAAVEKSEEPEEIFLVEPLEKEKTEPEPEPRIVTSAVPATPEPASEPMLFSQEPEPIFSALADQIQEEPVNTVEVAAPVAEAPRAEAVKPKIIDETPASGLERTAEPLADKSDDFTTDTLAELYIAQGFYEKAIDIYERMLGDNPNSRGLKDKLTRVREMASASAGAEEKPSADLFAEPQVYSAQDELADAGEKPKFFAEPEKELPPAIAPTWQEPVKEMELESVAPAPEPKAAQPKPIYNDFEPREYAPPMEEPALVETKTAPVEEKAERPRAATKSSTAIRKDTIERLESWLKNIKKES